MKKIYASSLFILILSIICTNSSGQSGQNLIPQSNNRFDLGAAANRWRNLYVNNIDASGNVNIGGTLGVTGITSLGGLQVQGPAKFTGIGAGILAIDATGALSAAPLTAGQIPSLPYLSLTGGNILGSLSARDATFTTLSTESFQVTSGAAAGSVLTSDGSGHAIWQQPPPITGFWSLTGNAGTVEGSNFIGTTDNVPLTFKVNNVLMGHLDLFNMFWGMQGPIFNKGFANVGFGNQALSGNTTGNQNTAIGVSALSTNSTGNGNTGVGYQALQDIDQGEYLTAVGYRTFQTAGHFSNSTALGNEATIDASNEIILGNTSIEVIKAEVTGITALSDGRFKKNIKENVPGLGFIMLLKPVSYNYDIHGINAHRLPNRIGTQGSNETLSLQSSKSEESAIAQKEKIVYTGFVAQDVESASNKAGYNFSGLYKPKNSKDTYGLNYTEFVVPLVKAVQELSGKNDSLIAVVADLRDSLAALIVQMNDRLAKIEQSMGLANTSGVSLNSAKLFQNAPNPFNQSTHISYYIPQNSGNASITVTDINGRNIKTVPIAAMGNGQISLQTAHLTAGTYVYSLYIDGTLIDSKKMVLTK